MLLREGEKIREKIDSFNEPKKNGVTYWYSFVLDEAKNDVNNIHAMVYPHVNTG